VTSQLSVPFNFGNFAVATTGKGNTYFEGFKKVVESADVILQVLDARDPCSCRCTEVERFVRKVDPNKRIILVLNKIGAPLHTPPPPQIRQVLLSTNCSANILPWSPPGGRL
jgi:hypothetical protein